MRIITLVALLWAGTTLAASYTNGPLVEVSAINLLADCTADDVPGQSAAGSVNFSHSQVEPWVAVNPVNPNNIVGIWQQDRWSDGGSRGSVAGVSFDGGTSWQPVVIPGMTDCSGGNFQRVSDPWISFAPDGTLHQLGLALDQDPLSGGFGRNGILTSHSTDGGLTWSAPVTLTETNDPAVLNDKDSITADSFNPNYIYAVWDRLQPFLGQAGSFTGPTIFARSTDGGQTWEPGRALNTPGKSKQTLGNQILALPNGTLVNVCAFIRPLKNRGARNAFATQRSLDRGATWQRSQRLNFPLKPRSAFVADGVDVFDPESGASLRTAEILPAVAVNPVNGMLCAVWQDSRFSRNAIDEIAFSQSTDAGRHWSKPVKINQTPTTIAVANRQAFTPSIRVAADGTICVTYYDFRFNDSSPDLKTDVWAIFCKPMATAPATNPANWGNEVRLTDASFDFLQAPYAGGYFVGDYEGLAVAGNDFLPFWAQPFAGNPVSVVIRRLSPIP